MQITALSSTSLGRLTAKDIRRMQADGLIDDDENFELIGGRIVPMGPKYHAHERLKSELGMALGRACPQDLIIGFETSLFLSPDTIVDPSSVFIRAACDRKRYAAATFYSASRSPARHLRRIAGRKPGSTWASARRNFA
jgi:Uma2 family endonuclease